MLRRQRVAVAALFLVNGAAFSSWLPRVPEVRDRLGLTLAELGGVLLGAGLGGLLASVAAGALVDRLGSRRSSVLGSLAVCAGLPLIAVAPTGFALAVVLVGLGAVDVVADIGMNVQATAVQRRSERSVMQRFHAIWSIGTLLGGGVGSIAAAADVGLGWQLSVTALLLAGVAVASRTGLTAQDDPPPPLPEGHRRRPLLILLAATAGLVAVVEGTPGDWAAVFGRDVHGAAAGVAGMGYFAITAGMVVGRLLGDRVTDRLGAAGLFRGALATVACGLTLVVLSPVVAVAIVGFGVIGLGVSVLFPAIYLRAADSPGVPSGLGVGFMSIGARFGFLASPPVVGAVAGASSLRVSLGVIMGAAIVGALGFDAALSRAARAAT